MARGGMVGRESSGEVEVEVEGKRMEERAWCRVTGIMLGMCVGASVVLEGVRGEGGVVSRGGDDIVGCGGFVLGM